MSHNCLLSLCCCAVLCCAVLCQRVMPSTAAKGSSNSTLAQRQQEEARQTVEIVPEAGTFGLTAVAGFLSPKVTIANLFANRVSNCHLHSHNNHWSPRCAYSQANPCQVR